MKPCKWCGELTPNLDPYGGPSWCNLCENHRGREEMVGIAVKRLAELRRQRRLGEGDWLRAVWS